MCCYWPVNVCPGLIPQQRSFGQLAKSVHRLSWSDKHDADVASTDSTVISLGSRGRCKSQ